MINVFIPVMILNRLGALAPSLTPWHVLLVALSFPIGGALLEWREKRKLSPIAALGALNVLGTGGLAALGLSGRWFAVKEAFFPFLIGCGVLYSAFGAKPFAETVFLNRKLLQLDKILESLKLRNAELAFHTSLKSATFALAGSFFLSAALNFGLAIFIFEPLSDTLTDIQRSEIINQQVARMTSLSLAVIAIPSTLCMAAILWKLVHDLRRHTGLTDHDLFTQ